MTVGAIQITTIRRAPAPTVTESNVAPETASAGKVIGYSLRQEIEVASGDVEKVASVSREVTELIKQGLFVESIAPQYLYTKLGDLKIEMMAEAAKDAKARAQQIASATGNGIGTMRSARMGVLQINAADSNEVTGYGVNDTTSLEKDITSVVSISFEVR
jgi:hypothetical protein